MQAASKFDIISIETTSLFKLIINIHFFNKILVGKLCYQLDLSC